MQQILADDWVQEDAGWSHILSVELPEIAGRERLVDHVDTYVRLYLKGFGPLAAAHARLGPARYGLDAEAMSSAALDAVRDDLAARLFAEDEAWRVVLAPVPGAREAVYQPAREREADWEEPSSGDGPGEQPDAEIDIAAELSRFRTDLGHIANSLTGHDDLRESVEAFRAEMAEMSEAFTERVTHAAGTIEDAARRVEASAALMPDPDRLELVLTRNEASAAILERGVRQSLTLLLQAVETMAEKGALPRRGAIEGPGGSSQVA